MLLVVQPLSIVGVYRIDSRIELISLYLNLPGHNQLKVERQLLQLQEAMLGNLTAQSCKAEQFILLGGPQEVDG